VLIIRIRNAEKNNLTLSIISVSNSLIKLVILYLSVFFISWTSISIWIIFIIYRCTSLSFYTILFIRMIWHLHGFFNMIIFSLTNKPIKDHIKQYNGWLIYIIAPIVLPIYLVKYINLKIKNLTFTSEEELLITSNTNRINI